VWPTMYSKIYWHGQMDVVLRTNLMRVSPACVLSHQFKYLERVYCFSNGYTTQLWKRIAVGKQAKGRRPVESHSGVRETIITGPHHLIPYMRRDRDADQASRGRKRWEGVPSPSD